MRGTPRVEEAMNKGEVMIGNDHTHQHRAHTVEATLTLPTVVLPTVVLIQAAAEASLCVVWAITPGEPLSTSNRKDHQVSLGSI